MKFDRSDTVVFGLKVQASERISESGHRAAAGPLACSSSSSCLQPLLQWPPPALARPSPRLRYNLCFEYNFFCIKFVLINAIKLKVHLLRHSMASSNLETLCSALESALLSHLSKVEKSSSEDDTTPLSELKLKASEFLTYTEGIPESTSLSTWI